MYIDINTNISVYTYINIYVNICVYTYILYTFIYTHTHTEYTEITQSFSDSSHFHTATYAG